MRLRVAAISIALAIAAAPSACGRGDSEGTAGAPHDSQATSAPLATGPDPLEALRAFETKRRSSTDFARLPPSDARMGADPYSIRRAPGGSGFVSILRGMNAVVALDASLKETARLPAPASPTGLAVTDAGEVFVSGELSPVISRYRIRDGGLARAGEFSLPGVRAIRDVAAAPDGSALYVVEEHSGRLITLLLGGAGSRTEGPRLSRGNGSTPTTPGADSANRGSAPPFERVDANVCSSASRVARTGDSVIIDCLIDHELIVRRVDSRGIPVSEGETRIRHDGPLWCFDALQSGDRMLIAAGGVEDHPLDRTEGSFGFIDSFVFLYEVPAGGGPATRLAQVNVSDLGVITPKALRLERGPEGTTLEVTGYGGDRQAKLVWRAELRSPPEASASALPPGTTSIADGSDASEASNGRRVLSNTLLDAWILVAPGVEPTIVPAAGGVDACSPAGERGGEPCNREVRLGEALFFTSLMAPFNQTEGRLSRFTCETCHFEGYVDGRMHHTGRGDVRATTKPLLGLFNNRPHFSRALDPDLATVAHSEFRVAGAKSGHDPWFSVATREAPWLVPLGAVPSDREDAIDPGALRRALMAFLMEFTHRTNPSVAGRVSFTEPERRGASVFRDHCESCHSARLSADDPGSVVPFEGWEALVMAREGAIVWARSEYKKTGVLPYVHERGARVPSLRRLYKKRPHFTNGSARTLAEVLDRARLGGESFYHDGAPEGASLTPLTADDREALLAFLDLL